MALFTRTPRDPLTILDTPPQKKSKSTIIFLLHYFTLTGVIFTLLLGITNFSAYSTRVMHWIDPQATIDEGIEIQSLLSHGVIQAQASPLDDRSDLVDRITQSIAQTHPELLYEDTDLESRLMTHMDEGAGKVSFDIVPYENRIIIPKLGKNIPLVDVHVGESFDFDHMENIFMQELEKGVVRYPGTAKPGQVGNSFIFGHSSNYPWIKSTYNDVFSLLDTLTPGDEIIVYYQQQSYTYRMKEKVVVKPGDVKALQSRDPTKKELSLMTCWPLGTDLNRMIVFAELVDDRTLARERVEKLRAAKQAVILSSSGTVTLSGTTQEH